MICKPSEFNNSRDFSEEDNLQILEASVCLIGPRFPVIVCSIFYSLILASSLIVCKQFSMKTGCNIATVYDKDEFPYRSKML